MKTNKIDNQDDLQRIFNNKSLYLKRGSILIFKTNLKLGNNIEFEGENIFGKNNKIESNCKYITLS